MDEHEGRWSDVSPQAVVQEKFLEAGPVRLFLKGLSQGEEHNLITTEGEMCPKDIADRDAEIEGFELMEVDGATGPTTELRVAPHALSCSGCRADGTCIVCEDCDDRFCGMCMRCCWDCDASLCCRCKPQRNCLAPRRPRPWECWGQST